jgi:hypothetical protein
VLYILRTISDTYEAKNQGIALSAASEKSERESVSKDGHPIFSPGAIILAYLIKLAKTVAMFSG